MLRRTFSDSGQALIFAAFFTVFISVAALLTASHFGSASSNLGGFTNQSRAYYATQGLVNIASSEISNYLALNAINNPTQAQIQGIVTARLPAQVPSGVTLNNLNTIVSNFSETTAGVIPTGPYRGMTAPISTFTITINATENATGYVANISSLFNVAQVSPFQFLFFISTGSATMNPASYLALNGRVHVNGTICLGSQLGDHDLQILNLTASGNVYALNNPACAATGTPSYYPADISTGTGAPFSTFANLFYAASGGGDSGCVNCNGGTLSWNQYAIDRWNTNVLDVTQNVPAILDLATGIKTQDGFDSTWNKTTNNFYERAIIDPVIPADGVGPTEKLAFMASVRIIDGVWYIPQKPAPGPGIVNWPGVPIWSDHPGSYTDTFGNAVGQDDLRTFWAAQGYPWPAAPATPQLFSYYAYNESTSSIFSTGAPGTSVISYGSIDQTVVQGATKFGPAGWVNYAPGVNSPLCLNNPVASGPTGLVGPFNGAAAYVCGGAIPPAPPSIATLLLNGTRSGFVDVHVQAMSQPPNQIARSNTLPINFDVKAFLNAETSTAPGELGSYFHSHGYEGHPIDSSNKNSLVWISSTWPGSLNGFSPPGLATEHPYQGSQTDPTQMGQINVNSPQTALPFPLCSNAPTDTPAGISGSYFDDAQRFKVPTCSAYSTGGTPIKAFPNAVRIINGSNLTMPTTIASNLPVYIAGDYNTSSNGSGSASSLPWWSSLIAGDQIIILSNSYSDKNLAWGVAPNTETRIASSTSINSAIYGGLMSTPGSLSADGMMGLMEDWSGQNFTYYGSIFLGHLPVYYYSPLSATEGASTYKSPTRSINFDQHFDFPNNHPNGTQTSDIFSVSKWSGY